MDQTYGALVQIAGSGFVFDDPDVLATYSRDISFAKPLAPRFVVKVQNAEQVEKLVRYANQARIPLIPVSSSKPHYKGDTVPSVPESIIVDLSGMKRVISINRTHRVAVIEPGVTYDALKEALASEGMTISMPLAPRNGKSVVGSILETEPRLNALHQWCSLDPLRCVEVIWGDGNRMFTGEAGASAMDLEKQWQEEKWQWEPVGPMMLDFYRLLTGAQGTMGIVTWASVRCEITPVVHKGFIVPARTLEDLIDFAYNVLRLRFSDEFFIMNGSALAQLMASDAEDAENLKGQLPQWMAIIGMAGREILPEERVAFQEQDISEIAQKRGLQLMNQCGVVTGEAVLSKATSTCGIRSWKDVATGAHQDIFFSTTLDRTPSFVESLEKLAHDAGYTRDIGVYIQPENMGTSCHCSLTIPYVAENKKESQKAKQLFEVASAHHSHMGAYYVRPYGIWSKLQLNKDAESYKVQQKLKAIFDPNGIMNPGKLCND